MELRLEYYLEILPVYWMESELEFHLECYLELRRVYWTESESEFHSEYYLELRQGCLMVFVLEFLLG